MRLYIVRHAEAIVLGTEGISKDSDRYLTEQGRLDALKVAKRLQAAGYKPDGMLTSPFIRARQTAEIFRLVWELPPDALQEEVRLQPEVGWKTFLKGIDPAKHPSLFLFGHEPELSSMIGWLIGKRTVHIKFAKGAVACLDVKERADRGGGSLRWILEPSLLL